MSTTFRFLKVVIPVTWPKLGKCLQKFLCRCEPDHNYYRISDEKNVAIYLKMRILRPYKICVTLGHGRKMKSM